MKTATAIHPAGFTLKTAALQAPAQVRVNHTTVLRGHDKAERRPWKAHACTTLCRQVQSLCYKMLTIAGIGILLYSAGMFLHPTGTASMPMTAGHDSRGNHE
jgi:hypothetical protein